MYSLLPWVKGLTTLGRLKGDWKQRSVSLWVSVPVALQATHSCTNQTQGSDDYIATLGYGSYALRAKYTLTQTQYATLTLSTPESFMLHHTLLLCLLLLPSLQPQSEQTLNPAARKLVDAAVQKEMEKQGL